jgi:hypothetical protein
MCARRGQPPCFPGPTCPEAMCPNLRFSRYCLQWQELQSLRGAGRRAGGAILLLTKQCLPGRCPGSPDSHTAPPMTPGPSTEGVAQTSTPPSPGGVPAQATNRHGQDQDDCAPTCHGSLGSCEMMRTRLRRKRCTPPPARKWRGANSVQRLVAVGHPSIKCGVQRCTASSGARKGSAAAGQGWPPQQHRCPGRSLTSHTSARFLVSSWPGASIAIGRQRAVAAQSAPCTQVPAPAPPLKAGGELQSLDTGLDAAGLTGMQARSHRL